MKQGQCASNLSLALQICGILFAVSVFGGGLYGCVAKDEARGQLAEQALVGDYNLIRRPDFAEPVAFRHGHKGDRASVEGTYRTGADWRTLRRYYDPELARLGWKAVSDEPLGSLYGEQGGRTARFCKGTFEARLDLAHQGARTDWSYALALSWLAGNRPEGCASH